MRLSRRTRLQRVVVPLALLVVLCSLLAVRTHVLARAATPGDVEMGSGRVFSAGSAFWTPIPRNAAIDPRSERQVSVLRTGASPSLNLRAYGNPVYRASAATPRHHLRITMQGSWGYNVLADARVPIPDGALPSTGSDGKLVIVDQADNRVYDLWRARKVGGQWQADWGGIYPLDGDGTSHRVAYGRGPNMVPWPDKVSRGTGSGVSSLAGLITATELIDHRIPHALVFATGHVCGPAQTGPFRYPATSTDGSVVGASCIPEGARVQLDPSIDLTKVPGLSDVDVTVGRALQKYGAYCTDIGGTSMAFSTQAPRTAVDADLFRRLGLTGDYAGLRLPGRLQVLASWNGR